MVEKFSRRIENTVGKGEIARYKHSVFKRLVLQTCKNQGLFGKGLRFLKFIESGSISRLNPSPSYKTIDLPYLTHSHTMTPFDAPAKLAF